MKREQKLNTSFLLLEMNVTFLFLEIVHNLLHLNLLSLNLNLDYITKVSMMLFNTHKRGNALEFLENVDLV